MWYFHEILGKICSNRAFRENPLSDVTVLIAPLSILLFLLYVKLSTDGILHVCRSELYIVPRCLNVFIFVGALCLIGCAFLYTVLFVLIGGYCHTETNIQINKQKRQTRKGNQCREKVPKIKQISQGPA